MSNEKIVQSVLAKLDWKKSVSKLALAIKQESDTNKRIGLITSFKDEYSLTDQQYAEILTSLIKSYQIYLLGADFKKELKKITNQNSFFDLTY